MPASVTSPTGLLPETQPESRGGAREWARILTRLAVAVLVLGGAYLALAWWSGRAVPASVSVDGVNIGGLSPEQARERLTKEFVTKAGAPVSVLIEGAAAPLTVDPQAAGLTLDLDATLDGLSGFTLAPDQIWARLTGHLDRRVATRTDRQLLEAALAAQAGSIKVAPVDGAISLAGGTVAVTAAKDGTQLAVGPTADAVAAGWLRSDSIQGVVTRTPPTITQGAVEQALRSFATPALSGPLTVLVGDQPDKAVLLSPAQLAPALSLVADGDRLTPKVDETVLGGVLNEAAAAYLMPAQDARIVLEGDRPQVRPSSDGVTLELTDLSAKTIAALTGSDRKLAIGTTSAAPALSTEQAQALGVNEIIASFDSAFPYDPPRTNNLVVAARTVNGTLIKPGETFSLNAVLGERTTAKGYQEAGVIANDRFTKNVGGGVSQISTVTYNIAWFAGARLDQHTPHSVYISRYPAGREATVSWPSLDNKWTNTSPYGMLVQMWVSGGQVHGRMWSTKVYDVEAVAGPRTNARTGKTIVDNARGCVPHEHVPGFDIVVTRVFSKGGTVVKRENYSTSYKAANHVICTNP